MSLRPALAALGLVSLAVPVHALDIVFIGNSFTHGNISPTMYYNADNITDLNYTYNIPVGGTPTKRGGIPGIFKKLADEGGFTNVNVSMEAISGHRLNQHYDEEKALWSRSWDFVVLQDYSTRTLDPAHSGDTANSKVDVFYSAVQNLRDLFRQYNANVSIMMYETWARPDMVPTPYATLQAMQDEITGPYTNAVTTYALAGLSPVGQAFMRAVTDGVGYDAKNTTKPNANSVNLWASDNYHPSIYGAYLSAMTHYSRILGGDPRALPTGTGSAAAALGITPTIAANLQQIAYIMTPQVPPSIVSQPTSRVAFPGGTVSFSVGATGPALTYQWRHNGVNISGATSSILTLSNVQLAENGLYDVVITTSTNATITSNSATLTVTNNSASSSFLIDFGSPTVQTASPDNLGRYWNNITSAAAGAGANPLISTTNVSRTGMMASVTKGFNSYNTVGVSSSALYPSTAQSDFFYLDANSNTKGTVQLSGLTQGACYTLKMFGSRSGSGARVSRYTISGLTPVLLDATDNTNTTASLGPVLPTSSSTLVLDVEPYNNGTISGFAYLGVLEITEQLPSPTPYELWAAQNGLSGTSISSTEDSDDDGVNNLGEWAMNSNPRKADHANRPVTSTVTVGGVNYTAITATKNPAATTVTYTVEVSSDLVNWTSGASSTTTISDLPNLLQVRDNTPVTPGTKRFMRMRITGP